MADRWLKARIKHQEKMLDGESPFYNFDYKILRERFQELNYALIEAENGQTELEQYIIENDFCTRVIYGQSYSDLEKLKKEARKLGLKSRGYKNLRLRDLSNLSYCDLITIVFYGRLTELKRAKANLVDNIGGIFKIQIQGEEFNLNLQNPDSWIDQEFQKWQEKETIVNPDFRFLILGEI